MGLPAKRDPEVLRDAVAILQVARPCSLRLFDDMAVGAPVVERKKVEVLNLSYERDRLRWEQLHNDPNVIIVDEKDHAVKVGVTTIIRYVQRTAIDDEDEDPMIAKLWSE